MGRGRKRKAGVKRTASGQISRAGQIVRPSDWVQTRLDRFGNHYSSALGRAYAGGLLGAYKDDPDAKVRLDAGNRFTLRYARTIGGDAYTCPLDRSPRGSSNDNQDSDRAKHQEQWLFSVMDALDRAGVRPWLDQLIHKNYTDTGPYWLDELLAGGRHEADRAILKAAIRALDIIAGFQHSHREVVDIPLHACHGAVNA